MNLPDDWEKPRSQANHLSDLDIQTLRSAYNCGLSARDAARSVKCSSRIAYKYFRFFRLGIVKRSRRDKPKFVYRPNEAARAATPKLPAPSEIKIPVSRFYKGNFEL